MTQLTSTAVQGPAGRRRILRLFVALAAALTAALIAAAAAGADPGDVVWRDFTQRAHGGTDAYVAIAVSAGGRVCAVGSTAAEGAPADVLVRTYSSVGSVLWRRVWTWPGGSDDAAAAVTRDRHGSCIVAGRSGGDALLLKYSPAGYLQWVRRGHGGFSRASFSTAAVDGSGNVYAAGEARLSSGGRRLLLRKYSPAGTLRWQRTLGSDGGDASAVALVVGGGDIYVAGDAATGDASIPAVVAKYSSSGVRRWVRLYASSPGDAVRATGIAFAGGPLVSGHAGPAGGPAHGFVVRYDTAGTPLWTASYASADATDDRFAAVVGDAGHVVVTGSRTADGASQMLTLGFDALGAPLWERVTPGAAGGTALCRVADGVLAAGGSSASFADRLSAAGSPLWLEESAPEGYEDFRAAAARAAGSEYLYVAGSARSSGGGTAAMLVRYRP